MAARYSEQFIQQVLQATDIVGGNGSVAVTDGVFDVTF